MFLSFIGHKNEAIKNAQNKGKDKDDKEEKPEHKLEPEHDHKK